MLLLLLEMLLHFTGRRAGLLRGPWYHSKLDTLAKELSSLQKAPIQYFSNWKYCNFFPVLNYFKVSHERLYHFPNGKNQRHWIALRNVNTFVITWRRKVKENIHSKIDVSGSSPYEWNYNLLSITSEISCYKGSWQSRNLLFICWARSRKQMITNKALQMNMCDVYSGWLTLYFILSKSSIWPKNFLLTQCLSSMRHIWTPFL